MDNFSDKVMSSIALSLIFITLCMSLAWNIWSQQTCRWHHLWRVPCRRGGGAVPPPRPGRSRRRRSREPSACPQSERVEEESRFSGSVNICDNVFHCRVFLLHSLCSWSRHTESLLHSSIYTGLSHIITYFQFKTDSDSLWYISTSENWEHKWNGRNNTDCCQLL